VATILDSLVVTLGLDSTKFQQGSAKAKSALKETRDEATKTAKEMEARGRQAAGFFTSMRTEALALFSVLAGGVGLTSFLANTFKTTAALDRQSKVLGVSAQKLAEYQLAAKRAGGSAADGTGLVGTAQDAIGKFRLGDKSGLLEELARQGAGADALTAAAKGDADGLLAISQKVLRQIAQQRGAAAAYVEARTLGFNEVQTQMMLEGRSLDEQRAAVRGLATEQAKAAPEAERMRQKWVDFENQLNTTALTIFNRLLPTFELLEGKFTDLGNWIAGHQGDINRWVDSAVESIKNFTSIVGSAVDAVGGWKNALLILGGLKVLSMTAPLFQLAAALGSIGTALGLIGGSSAAAGLGILGKLGLVGVISYGALKAAKAAGLPDVDQAKGEKEYAEGKYLAASTHMSAGSLIKKAWNDITGTFHEGGAAALRGDGSVDPQKLFAQKEGQYGLPAGLLDNRWQAESGRGRNMLSPAGAKGHFQFMDGTAKQYGLKDPNDLGQAADAAARYYRDLLKHYGGDVSKAAAAYNWGQGNVDKDVAKNGDDWLKHAPKETQGYVMSLPKSVAAAAPQTMSRSETTATAHFVINAPTGDANQIASKVGEVMRNNFGFTAMAVNSGQS
jgi:hypothetical protein